MTTSAQRSPQPLDGIVVVECGGIGPVPFAGLLLAELGAEVVRVDRPGTEPPFGMTSTTDPLLRGKRLIDLDLRSKQGVAEFVALVDSSDVLIEGYRPGVMERLGLGPDVLREGNPGLVYGRMTGWGQGGPRAHEAGHDINYLALTGALAAIGPEGRPAVPLNLVGDFGGGSLYLVTGVLSALFARQRSGQGATVDAAIVDGVCHLMGLVHGLDAAGSWQHQREANYFDGGAPFYTVYETADGKQLAVGAVEPRFFAAFLRVIGADELLESQYERATWAADRERIGEIVGRRSRDEWERSFDGVDACVTPVLSLREASTDPHLQARGSLLSHGNGVVPGPAPRFL